MAVVGPASEHHRSRWGASLAAGLVLVVAFAIAMFVVRSPNDTGGSAGGSGHAVTEHRDLPSFTAVDLAGTNTVIVHVGRAQSVAVTADDNLVDRVTTTVRDGRLVIGDRGSFTTKATMTVVVSVPSLTGVAVRATGTGTVMVDGVAASGFVADLSGDGTLTVSGVAQRVRALLPAPASGTLDAGDLVAREVVARLDGTGTIKVHATATLDATLRGTGTILYWGSPVVTSHNTGEGTVVGE
jgi:hypothetical protein